ncbi:hypothetical protein AB0D08_30020 [Kitasatospora sp. NPDC048540]|uniref:hypothetical protein n=1 Tax=Kitasatospora sp. NPDC048540 TaxID=3155634 RepID=UPI0033E9EAF0
MTDNRNHLRRALATAVLAAGLSLAAAPLALAADGPAPAAPADLAAADLAPADLAAARAAVQTPAVLDRLGRFFARGGVPPTGGAALAPAEEERAAAQAAPRLTGESATVFTLDAGFVAGTADAPVASPDFVATKAVSADGRIASVWSVRQGAGWRVVNIATGGDETDYPARAAGTGGGTAFREPQLDAWYVLRGGRVLPLDEQARRSVGADGVSVAAYQKLVHQRYGDKLPGSAYDRAGTGGGFDTAAPARDGGRLPALTAGAALGATALTGAALAARRRSARR